MTAQAATQNFAESTPQARKRMLMISMLVSSLLASLDTAFVPIAFPDLIDKLNTSTGIVVWVTLGYLVAATGPMLLSARMGDSVGLARMFQAGTVIYALAMIACTWAPDIETLIALRLIQGLGMAIFLPSTFAMATLIHAGEERGKALGLLQAANALGFVLGPIFAGFLLDSYDWRAIFGSRIPMAILAIVLAFVAFGFAEPYRTRTGKQALDKWGALYLTLAMFGLIFGLSRLPVEDNYLDWWMWLVLVLGALFLVLFVRHEKRFSEPLIDFSLFDNNRFTKASVAFTTLFASYPIYLFTLPIVMINGMEIRAWTVGMVLAVVALCTMLVSPAAGRHADRIGPERLCNLGVILSALGYFLLACMQADSSIYYLLLPLVLIGVGAGLFFTPNNHLLMTSVPPPKLGMASGLIGTYRQVGYAVGFAVSASLFTAIQNLFEANWAYAALQAMESASASHIAHMFHEGGPWSPEVLIYVLRMTAIVGIATLLVSYVNVLPKLALKARQQLMAMAASVVLALLGTVLYSAVSEVSLSTDQVVLLSDAQAAPVQAFGMDQRVAVAFNEAETVDAAALFMNQCAACHGVDAKGVAQLGVTLVGSGWLAQADQNAFAQLLREGRMPGAPDSQTGRMMPPFAGLDAAQSQSLYQYLTNL